MTIDPDRPVPFGLLLRRWRQAAGLSLAALARQVHYSKGYLSKVETGQAKGTQQLAMLCDVVLDTGGELAARTDVETNPDSASSIDPSRLMIEYGLEFLATLDSAHNGLRNVARSDLDPADRGAASVRAVQDSGLYTAREHLLAAGSVRLVTIGEAAFRGLIDIRNEVRSGADLESAGYHRAYHAFSDILWSYRMAIRAELGQPVLIPAQLDLADWSDRDRCPTCGGGSGAGEH